MPTNTAPSTKRGRPAFKPPRPFGSKSSRSKPTTRRKSAPATIVSSSSESDERIPSDAAGKSTDSEIDLNVCSAPASSTQDPPPIIPPQLITRTLYHHLEKADGNDMKIGKEANSTLGKYFDTFVREAIARAAFERSQADEAAGTGDGFLEVRCHGNHKHFEGMLTLDTGGRFGKVGAATFIGFLNP
ncbi:MAG: hypothetical protein Q9178_002875 [Gyalolechia marmorata]